MSADMTPCHLIEIGTPKKYVLNGLWFGPQKPKRVIILVHGLGGSMLGSIEKTLSPLLADKQTAVLSFNNRGHDMVSKLYRTSGNKKGYTRTIAGAAHEVFTDCVDDIQGAIDFANAQGVKEIYLAGHSTGCQKAAYWAAKKGQGVKGIILLAPISDYAGLHAEEKGKHARAVKTARALIAAGTPHMLLPDDMWPTPVDAQRFLSLYTPDSIEQSIFSYFDESKTPRILRSIRIPLLVLLAEQDEYADRPARDIAAWFEKHAKVSLSTHVISGVGHSFRTGEKVVVHAVQQWMTDKVA